MYQHRILGPLGKNVLMWIRYRIDYPPYKAGDHDDVDRWRAKRLVALGIAELAGSPRVWGGAPRDRMRLRPGRSK